MHQKFCFRLKPLICGICCILLIGPLTTALSGGFQSTSLKNCNFYFSFSSIIYFQLFLGTRMPCFQHWRQLVVSIPWLFWWLNSNCMPQGNRGITRNWKELYKCNTCESKDDNQLPGKPKDKLHIPPFIFLIPSTLH